MEAIAGRLASRARVRPLTDVLYALRWWPWAQVAVLGLLAVLAVCAATLEPLLLMLAVPLVAGAWLTGRQPPDAAPYFFTSEAGPPPHQADK